MKFAPSLAIAGMALMPTTIALGAAHQPVYDTLIAGTDGVAMYGDVLIDDIRVDPPGPSVLVILSVSVTAPADGDPQTSDISVFVARDGGDGVPDLDGSGDDTMILQTFRPDVTVDPGATKVLVFNVFEQFATVDEDSLLFCGLQSTNGLVAHAFYGAPVVGTTDPNVYSLLGGGAIPAPGVEDPALTQSMGLGIRFDAHPLPDAGPGGAVLGPVVDFESYDEGFLGTTLAIDGATIERGWDGFSPPEDATLAIDDGTGVWDANPGMLDFVQGKCLQLNGFSSGPDGYLFTLMRRLMITPDEVHDAAAVSVNYVANSVDVDYRQSVISLFGIRNGIVVVADSVQADNELGVSGGGSFTFGASRLSISGVEFDQLALFVNGGPGVINGLLGGIDNLVIGDAGPPGDVDGDGLVGVSDLLAVLAGWGDCDGACPEDVNGDGQVDVSDLLIVLANWS